MAEPALAAKLSDKLSGQSAVSQDAAVQAEHTFVFAKRYLNSDRAYSCQGMRILLACSSTPIPAVGLRVLEMEICASASAETSEQRLARRLHPS